ncbi:MAG: hypothetical protein HYU42_16765 [Candidatus Rokubacteria bacterium]|nr:hypothetical protein [Candidatus Rokubacteria bacterium]
MAKVQKSTGREVGMKPWEDHLTRVAEEMRRAVARLRSILASDAAGLRVAWPEPAGSTPAFSARGKPELNGDWPGQVEQRVALRLERRTP